MRRAAEVAVRAAKAYGEDHCVVFAGGVTYFALVSLFPMLLFALSVAGYIFADAAEQSRLVDNLLDALPIDRQSGRGDLEQLIESVVEARGTLGLIGLAGSAYSASALFGAVRVALTGVFKDERKRPFWLAKAADLGQVMLFSFLLLLSVAVTVGITMAQRFSEELFGSEAASLTGWLLNLGYALVPTVLSGAVFFLLYTLIPVRSIGRRNALAGGLTAGALFELLKVVFAQYVANFGSYDATYGTLGFVIILLAFFNFSAQVMLLGAEVGRAGFDMGQDAPAERFRETDALRRKAARFLPAPLGGRLVAGLPALTPGLPIPAADRRGEMPEAVDARAGAQRPPQPAGPCVGREPETRKAAERPGALSGLVLVAGLLVVAVTAFRKR